MSNLQRLGLGDVEAICDDTGVKTLRDVPVCLLQEFADKQHNRGRAVAADIVLSGRSSRDHDSSRVLNLHLAQQDVTVLGKLDLYRSIGQLGFDGVSRGVVPGLHRQQACELLANIKYNK